MPRHFEQVTSKHHNHKDVSMTQLGSSHIYSGLDDDMMIDEQMMDPEDGEDDEEIRKMRREMKNGVLDQ
tara:strand:+ start:335 stop:541 length:207 start_codon:yes stop_codon:yes gene_type:complete